MNVTITPPHHTYNQVFNKPNNVHLYWLDLIRFTAAFLVVLCHFRGAFLPEFTKLPVDQQTPLVFISYALTRLGHEAVLIFFVLSGYLVGGRAIEKIRQGCFDLRNYAVDRFVRIMLPLTSALLLFLPKEIICGNEIAWKDWVGCFFSLQGLWTGACIEPLWSLSYEVWFYILTGAAFAVICLESRRSKVIGSIVLVICFLVFTKLLAHYLLIWLLGAVAYVTMPKRQNKWLLIGSIILLSLMIPVLQLTSGGHVTSSITAYLPTQNRYSLEVIYSVVCCVLLQQIVLIRPKGKLSNKINRIGTKLATFSYTLYLVHVLVLRLLEHFGAVRATSLSLQSILLYLFYTLVAVFVCYGVYWCCERHTYAVKTWIKKRIK